MPHTVPERPRVLLVPPPALPVPAVQGGAVETLLTHLLRENERRGELELYCACIPDAAAMAAAANWQHNHMLYLPVPPGRRRWLPLNAVQRLLGVAPPPWQPWYQALLLTLIRQKIHPDLVFAEGGDLLQVSAISRYFGCSRTLAHLHGETNGSPTVDRIFGGVAAISDFVRDRYLQNSALPPQNAYVLRNCIDTARFCPAPRDDALRARFGFAATDFVVVFCGRLQPEKGIAELLEALALLDDPTVKLLIIGSPFFAKIADSPFLQALQTRAAALGDRVRFTGFIPNEELPAYYRLADLACVPSTWQEPAGLVPVEAMACGLPLLATRSGGMPEYIRAASPYFVDITPDLPRDLAEGITALRGDAARRAAMAAAGAAAAQQYSPENYYRDFVALVHTVLQKGAAS